MTTLYFRATGTGATGAYLSPTAGGTQYYQSGAGYDPAGDGVYYFMTFSHVTGATETWTGTASTASTVITDTSWTQVTKTYTPSAQTISGGTVLKVATGLLEQYEENNPIELCNATFYSGPLVATGISSTQWTISARMYATSSYGYIGWNESYSYIDGITLTGEPTTMRLYTQNTNAPIGVTTYQGTWDNTNTTDLGLGHKSGTGSSASVSAIAGTYLRRTFVSLPLVQDASITDLSGCLSCYESDAAANAYVQIHAWVSQGVADTLRGTILSNWSGGNEASTVTATAGRAIDPTGSSVSASAGDRIILESGFNVGAGTYTVNNYWGSINETDLSEGASPLTYPGWIELTLGSGSTNATAETTSSSCAATGSVSSVVGEASISTSSSSCVAAGGQSSVSSSVDATADTTSSQVEAGGLISLLIGTANINANAPPSSLAGGGVSGVDATANIVTSSSSTLASGSVSSVTGAAAISTTSSALLASGSVSTVDGTASIETSSSLCVAGGSVSSVSSSSSSTVETSSYQTAASGSDSSVAGTATIDSVSSSCVAGGSVSSVSGGTGSTIDTTASATDASGGQSSVVSTATISSSSSSCQASGSVSSVTASAVVDTTSESTIAGGLESSVSAQTVDVPEPYDQYAIQSGADNVVLWKHDTLTEFVVEVSINDGAWEVVS